MADLRGGHAAPAPDLSERALVIFPKKSEVRTWEHGNIAHKIEEEKKPQGQLTRSHSVGDLHRPCDREAPSSRRGLPGGKRC